jgi:hypothetical protein
MSGAVSLQPPLAQRPLLPDGQWALAWVQFLQALADRSAANPLATTGGTMTGALILSGPPATALGAATMAYVDTGVATDLAAVTALAARVTVLEALGTSLVAATPYPDDVAAAAAGVPIGGFYRNGSVVQVRVV